MSDQGKPPDDDLDHKLAEADWNVGKTMRSTEGMTLVFRKHYSSNFPGVEARTVSGRDTSDAMRKFLAELSE